MLFEGAYILLIKKPPHDIFEPLNTKHVEIVTFTKLVNVIFYNNVKHTV